MKRISDFLAGLPMTIIAGVFLLFDLLPHMIGEFDGEIVNPSFLPIDPAWVTVIISGIPLMYLAIWRMIYNPGISKISSALLICIAMFSAIAIGDLFAAGEVAFIMAVGALLEEATTNRAKKGLQQLIHLVPTKGRRLEEGEETIIRAEEIRRGDVLRVLPGETIPVDGRIISGETSVDQSIMTGESLPVDKAMDDEVLGGTINRFGSIDILTTKVGENSSLQKLIRMVQDAENKKAPIQRIADRAASWLVPVALMIAILSYVFTGNIITAVTVLVVFCPCALVLATPTAVMAAIGQATKHGVIIKSGEALEKMGKVDIIAFDKTGTLTYPVYALLSNTDAAVQIQHPGDRTADTNNGKTVAVTADQGMELSNAEARIGDTGYMSLVDAIQQAASGDTVTLLQKYEDSVQIEIAKAITIELGATGTSPDQFIAGDGYHKEISGTKLVFSSSSSSGGGSSSSGNKTETIQNPDGSTTTTVTRPDGSTTATTKYPDGSTEVVDTKKDGTVTTTTTDADGNKTQVVENTDGSSKTTIDRKDGSGSVTIVDENGNVVSQTTLSESAIKAAQTAGKPVELPIPAVTASADAASAPTVTVGLQGNTPIKVEIPVGNITPGTVAVLVMEDGTEEIIKTTIAMENGVVVTLADGATVKLVDNTKAFADVPDVYWGADEIAFAASRALMNGTGSSTFSPEAPMTRAMVVTVLVRYEGVDTTTGETWYDAGRDWAMENGVSDGTDMDASVTSEQLAAMLWRYAGEPAVSGAVTGFTDAGKISDWAADAMAWAVENGLLNGVDDGRLAPQSTATRAQVAAILTRFVALTA